jgi:subtilase family serine protease
MKDGRARVVSISAGLCDVPGTGWTADDRRQAEQTFSAAANAGITIFVSTGDYGAYACQQQNLKAIMLATKYPANSSSVVGVGGTRLSVRGAGGYAEETGWEDVLSAGGGGGGLNPYDARPTWQRADGVDNGFSTGRRQVPDVSAAADPDSGFFVVWQGEPARGGVGGTSAATPFWAASTALMAQYAATQGISTLGYLNPTLYAIASTPQPYPAFHDVVRGGNRFYNATPGWDYPTGLGSPDVYNLARDIALRLKGT